MIQDVDLSHIVSTFANCSFDRNLNLLCLLMVKEFCFWCVCSCSQELYKVNCVFAYRRWSDWVWVRP